MSNNRVVIMSFIRFIHRSQELRATRGTIIINGYQRTAFCNNLFLSMQRPFVLSGKMGLLLNSMNLFKFLRDFEGHLILYCEITISYIHVDKIVMIHIPCYTLE